MSDICSVLAYGLLQLRGLARWQVYHSIAVHTNPKRKISGALACSADLGLGELTSQTARRKSLKILAVYLALYDYIITHTHTQISTKTQLPSLFSLSPNSTCTRPGLSKEHKQMFNCECFWYILNRIFWPLTIFFHSIIFWPKICDKGIHHCIWIPKQ